MYQNGGGDIHARGHLGYLGIGAILNMTFKKIIFIANYSIPCL